MCIANSLPPPYALTFDAAMQSVSSIIPGNFLTLGETQNNFISNVLFSLLPFLKTISVSKYFNESVKIGGILASHLPKDSQTIHTLFIQY